MNRLITLLLLIVTPLIFTGCGDGNSDAPPSNGAHSASWIKDHPSAALATADFADCVTCHADNLQGSGNAVSCYSCHAYNTGTDFRVHPDTWLTAFTSHRGAADKTTCANCHGADLSGSQAAPSCLTASFDGLGCHAGGPGEAIHPLDGSYLDGTAHGPTAKADLVVCQGCHAEAGGKGSNPRFNVGILSGNGTGCEFCHGATLAHPPEWLGLNSLTFHGTSANMANACALCHGIDLNGIGGVGVSCLSCHSSPVPLN